ncbi:N-6 DNA Methylase [uncultured archaeon]|nr:N-6 DNA Methylase [uncultured archaeon]
MSKYDSLDARKELEQEITKDLKRALEKRGFTIHHNGTAESHAPGGKPDIEAFDQTTHINIEVTKSKKSAQDREWQSIKDHFEQTKIANATKKCFLIFVSPETYYRTVNSMKDWNFAHEEVRDQKMIPLCFDSFELLMNKLIGTPASIYPKLQLLGLFDGFVQFVDDENTLRHLFQTLFSTDLRLKVELEKQEEERHQFVVEELIGEFKQLEQKLREERIALAGDAIKTVVYLVFIKLYEEKKEKEESQKNRFTEASFREYQSNVRDTHSAIHKLFDDIKSDPELERCNLFTDADSLPQRLTDEFVIESFIKPFEQYTFFTTKVDGLGAAYEVLGQLSGKDVKVGQFFTPENVVRFMVKMAELAPDDFVLDPACGTARFLTYSMEDMLSKAAGVRNESQKMKDIRAKQLLGTDDDPTVAKLAKMNMYIHGDGKTNIIDADGLTRSNWYEKVDVVLTNPPLGNISYLRSIYDENFRTKQMEVIPKKNLTEEELAKIMKQIQMNQTLQAQPLSQSKLTRITARLQELRQKETELRGKIRDGAVEYATTGTQMKGGALFLNACKFYLKDVRDSSQHTEWRGGKVLIILDEGVLNTDDYKEVRDFIRKYFYIKAVISLTRDTFVPVSNTSTKTSILYAIKKEDLDAIQQEPIFFGHVEKVGLDTKKKVCSNHLFGSSINVLSKYIEFKQKVLSSYTRGQFNKELFLKQGFKIGEISG